MNKYLIFVFSLSLSVSSSFADIDCPADSSYHVDMRTMLPDGSPNPTYGQQISTGLCACEHLKMELRSMEMKLLSQ